MDVLPRPGAIDVHGRAPATELRRFHILSGAIVPICDKIMGSSGIHNVKIARAALADGRALVGLNMSPSDVPNVKQRLGIALDTPHRAWRDGPRRGPGASLRGVSRVGEASAEEILGLLAGGAIIELDNGWQLTTARIAGDEVVELVLNGVPANRAELERYGLSEEIMNYKRRWFVVLDDTPSALLRVLRQRRAVRDMTIAEIAADVRASA